MEVSSEAHCGFGYPSRYGLLPPEASRNVLLPASPFEHIRLLVRVATWASPETLLILSLLDTLQLALTCLNIHHGPMRCVARISCKATAARTSTPTDYVQARSHKESLLVSEQPKSS